MIVGYLFPRGALHILIVPCFPKLHTPTHQPPGDLSHVAGHSSHVTRHTSHVAGRTLHSVGRKWAVRGDRDSRQTGSDLDLNIFTCPTSAIWQWMINLTMVIATDSREWVLYLVEPGVCGCPKQVCVDRSAPAVWALSEVSCARQQHGQ